MPDTPDTAEVAAIARKLTPEAVYAITVAEALVDGRVLVPAYSVPDHLTRIYSVQRSALNSLGLAVRNHLLQEQDR